MSQPTEKGAVALTFDDHFTTGWLSALDVFGRYDAKVTFCVHAIHTLPDQQIKALHHLQDQGHEIAHHSRTHPRHMPYIKRFGLEKWLAEEVDRATKEHRAHGFPAHSFAAPFHQLTPKAIQALAKRFTTVRGRGPIGAVPDHIATRLYTGLGKHRIAHNLGSLDMRHPSFSGWDWQETVLDAVAQTGQFGVFSGHNIAEDAAQTPFYLTLSDLERMLDAVQRRGLRTYTLRQLGDASPREFADNG